MLMLIPTVENLQYTGTVTRPDKDDKGIERHRGKYASMGRQTDKWIKRQRDRWVGRYAQTEKNRGG